MRPIQELFNGGVVTSRIGALLQSGELQRADDCVYREKDPAIHRAPGRTALNATALVVLPIGGAATAVKGLSHLSYERTRTDQLLAYAGTTLQRAPLSVTTPPTLDALVFAEVSGPAKVNGTITGTSFAATTGNPFLGDILGASVSGPGVTPGTYVTAVSTTADGVHYSALTLNQAPTPGTGIDLVFDYGCVVAMGDNGDEILDTVQFGPAYFAWFGTGAPRRIGWRTRQPISGTSYPDTMISRPVGLNAVRSAPTIAEVSSASYAWNSVLGVGYYWFLITEVYAPGGDVIAAEKDANLRNEVVESAYLAPDPTSTDPNSAIGRPIAVNLSAVTGKGIQITFPAVKNDGTDGRIANNWAVYMYGPTTDGVNAPSLAQFRRIRTIAMTQYTSGFTYVITESSLAPQLKYPATRGAGPNKPAVEFTNPDFMLSAPNGTFGFSKSGTGNNAPYNADAEEKLTNYGFVTSGDYASASIVGVEVQVTGMANTGFGNSDRAGFLINVVNLVTNKFTQAFPNAFGAYGTIYFGGPTNTLGVGWQISDINANFGVLVNKGGSGAKQTLAIDAVGIKLYFNGGSINLNGPAYRVVTFRDQIGLTISDPANMPPPECSTGDFFQGMLVLNDLSDETAVRYSMPGRPEAFPSPYVMRFNTTKRHDRVTLIKTIGQVLVVAMENSIERVNYLPREVNTDLADGLSHEPIAPDHGIPGPFCGVVFDMPGKGAMMAYASAAGVYLTNGIWTIPMNMDLDWANTVKLSALSTAVMRVYPKEKWLALYYCPAGATHNKNTRVLYFCYQIDKLKGEYHLPAVGPCVVSGRSACEAFLGGRSYLLTGHESNGTVYWEDNGVTVPSGYQVRLNDDSANGDGKTTSATDVTIVPLIRTREFYPSTLDRDGYGDKVYLLFSPFGTNTVTATGATTKDSTTMTVSGVSGTIVKGMRVKGDSIYPGTIVVAVSGGNVTLSRGANATGSNAITFDTGTIGITARGNGLGEATKGLSTDYVSTLAGKLVSVVNGNFRRGFELQIEKVPLTFDANGDTLTWADLGVAMRLHTITYMTSESGLPDTNRNTT